MALVRSGISLWFQEDYTTDEEALAAHGVKGGAGGILDLLKASKQVAGLDSATLGLDFLDQQQFSFLFFQQKQFHVESMVLLEICYFN